MNSLGKKSIACGAIALALCAGLAGCRKSVTAPPNESKKPVKLAVPAQGKYTGAYIDFGDQEDDVTLEAIENFEAMVELLGRADVSHA